MITVAKPRMDVDVIELPATVIVCGASECERPATEMFHHSLCGGGNPLCSDHADKTREFLRRRFVRGGVAEHIDCDQDATPTNHSFRPT